MDLKYEVSEENTRSVNITFNVNNETETGWLLS